MKSYLLDSHCHINEYNNPGEIAGLCEQEQILTMAVTNHPAEYASLKELAAGSAFILPALGFHPMHAADYEEVYSYEGLFREADYIGEIGLDFSLHYRETREQQLVLFEAILGYIKGKRRRVTIHSRRAEREVLELLAKYGIESPILHWYSGGMQLLAAALEYGCYFSINSSMLSSEKGQKVIKRVPPERILTETDGPYLEEGGEPLTPAAVKDVYQYLSRLWKLDFSETIAQVHENFMRVAKS